MEDDDQRLYDREPFDLGLPETGEYATSFSRLALCRTHLNLSTEAGACFFMALVISISPSSGLNGLLMRTPFSLTLAASVEDELHYRHRVQFDRHSRSVRDTLSGIRQSRHREPSSRVTPAGTSGIGHNGIGIKMRFDSLVRFRADLPLAGAAAGGHGGRNRRSGSRYVNAPHVRNRGGSRRYPVESRVAEGAPEHGESSITWTSLLCW